ncbi:hypothetical protein D3C77_323570 [compost metagenome]
MHVCQTQGAIFCLALVIRQQHTATGHGLEILDHVLAHAHIGTDEETYAVERVTVLFTGLGPGHQQVFNLRQLVQQRLAPAVGHAIGATDKGQLDIPFTPLVGEQLLVIALGHELGVEAFLAQALTDHVPGADHPRPRQLAVMRTELAGVLARDVVLVGVVFEDDQVRHRPNETDLTDFLLETQEKHDPIILFNVDFATEITAQVALIGTAEPAQIAFAMGSYAVVETIEDGPLFFLHQK